MPDQSDAIRWATEPSARCRPNQHRGRREAALELSAPETARDIGISSAAEQTAYPTAVAIARLRQAGLPLPGTTPTAGHRDG